MNFNREHSSENTTLHTAGMQVFLMMLLLFFIFPASIFAQKKVNKGMVDAGVATINITPEWPIRLAGFAVREKSESRGVLQNLHAKALAFGNDAQGPSIIITVDLIGIPGDITRKLAERLAAKVGLDPARLAICASHTHSGPELGNLLNILQYRSATAFSDSLLPTNQMNRISLYLLQLADKLEQVALEALKARQPSHIAWGQGQVSFAQNRRLADGPVDHAMPLIRVTDPEGKLTAVFLNYSCHAVSLGSEINQIHGDWVGEAQRMIEDNHPGITALIAVGCGADANPTLNGL